jgi:hypothetical protein
MVVLLIGLQMFFKRAGKDLLEKRTALPCLASCHPYPKRGKMAVQSPFSTILKGIFPQFLSPLKVKKFILYHLAQEIPDRRRGNGLNFVEKLCIK